MTTTMMMLTNIATTKMVNAPACDSDEDDSDVVVAADRVMNVVTMLVVLMVMVRSRRYANPSDKIG